ncbi:site-specific DNA-methyltransferase [Flavobacterium sp. LB2P74]|uniref:site-specific DNA-methyltransferase n=1 Tax=Flavobacterium sp. LB2P74 TaxID=3401717 RepID=UPI003AAE0C2D
MEKIIKGDELTQSLDIVNDNIARLKELFPEVFTEGKIDFKVLQDVLGDEIETEEEYYRFTWAGKAQARREAHKPSTGTLRPCKEDSVNWDTTENLYIEGDNLEVLKLLQKSYNNKVKMIYIDPPYNTGKDFVYKDNYKDNLKNYQQISGQIDDEGNKLTTNSDSDGRYHSNWLNMMYPRLKLARNLLTDDGVIFISINNIEVHNSRKLCDEIFGQNNFVECIIWNKRIPKNDKGIGSIHEYILIYTKNSELEHIFTMPKGGLDEIFELTETLKKSKILINLAEKEVKKLYKRKDYDRGITLYNSLDKNYNLWGKINMSWPNANTFGPRYEVLHPKTKKPVNIPDRGWRWKEETFNEAVDFDNIIELHDGSFMCGKIWFAKDENTQPSSIKYLNEVNDMLLRSIVSFKSDGGIEAENLFNNKSIFSYPKPTSLLKAILSSINLEKSIVLDFFSGSSTTADAVLQINALNGFNNKFIMVQLPENLDENLKYADNNTKQTILNAINFLDENNKPHFLTELGKERIKRAGKSVVNSKLEELKKLKAKNSLLKEDSEIINNLQSTINNLDTGFKVFKLDSSNIKGWDGNPDNLEQNLFDSQDNIKTDRSEEDVLFEILLKYGLDLTLPIEEKIIEGKKVFNVGLGALFICLADDITSKVAEGIGKWKEQINPETCRAIFKDSGFTDVEKTNAVQTLKRFGIHEIKSI